MFAQYLNLDKVVNGRLENFSRIGCRRVDAVSLKVIKINNSSYH